MKKITYKDGENCTHIGCCQHLTHPCENCNRIACMGDAMVVEYSMNESKRKKKNEKNKHN